MILQMVAEGKITPDEAEQLLQVVDETEQATQSAVADTAREAARGTETGSGLGESIDRVVKESLRGLDQSMRHIEDSLNHHLDDPTSMRLRVKLEEKMRRVAQRAAEQARRVEERVTERAAAQAEREAERAAEQAEREAERAAEKVRRVEERAARLDERGADVSFRLKDYVPVRAGEKFFKVGISIDKVSVDQNQQLTQPVVAGDRILLENRVGDVNVQFYGGDLLEVQARMEVWGEDDEDARERAAATQVELIRHGSDVAVAVIRPTLSGVGIMHIKDTRIDFNLRVPNGCHLQMSNKTGDLTIQGGDKVGSWNLLSKVGNIEIALPPEAEFAYDLKAKLGKVTIDRTGAVLDEGPRVSGQIGEGGGRIEAISKTGSVQIHRSRPVG